MSRATQHDVVVRLFHERAEGHRERNLISAKLILSTPASFGRFGGLFQWARRLLRREQARLNRLRARQVAA